VQDIKYAFRILLKNPLFSTVAVLTLALGIGATTAIYTVVEAVLLEPLPFEESDELAMLWTRNDEQNQDKYMVSPMDFDDWRTQNATFESMAAYWPTTGTVTEADADPTRVKVVYTTEDFFDVMGASSLLGRAYTPEDGPGSTQIAILSHGFWQRRFGADPGVIGRALTLDGQPIEVVGVIRPEQTFPEGVDLWTNMTWTMQIQSRGSRWMSAVGRLKDGTDLATARLDMSVVAARVAQQNPGTNQGWTVTMERLQDEVVGDTKTALWVLLGATALILLIACANVANLLLSRSETRAREIAIRVAFGADRRHLIRQLVTESLVLAGVGGLLGLGLAQVGVRVLLGMAPVTLPDSVNVGLDGTVLGVVVGVVVLTGILFGLAPMARLLSSEVHETIRHDARASTGGRSRGIQNAFVVGQFALALMLVVGAGLLVRSFQNLRSIDTGFSASGVLTAELDLATSVAENDIDVTNFYEQFEQSIAELPGVQAVGDASTLPLAEALDYVQEFTFANREMPTELEPRAFLRPVTPGFFDAMGTPVVEGRAFDSSDRVDGRGVVIVNESFVQRFLDGDPAVGEQIGDMRQRLGPLGAIHIAAGILESEIVGVVKDVRYDGLRADAVPAIYLSGLQSSVRRRAIAIRTLGDPQALAPQVRQVLAGMNPNVALTNVQPMMDVLSEASERDRFSTLLLTLFGVIALILASVGVYGVLAYSVEQRTSELGIRMAIGADRGKVRAMVLMDGVRLVVIGLAIGIAGAVALSGVLASQLYAVDPRDPLVYGAVLAVLLAAGLAGSFVPAWRATQVDPLIAMRAD
jgi:putative ABC transport system permease protein